MFPQPIHAQIYERGGDWDPAPMIGPTIIQSVRQHARVVPVGVHDPDGRKFSCRCAKKRIWRPSGDSLERKSHIGGSDLVSRLTEPSRGSIRWISAPPLARPGL